MTPTAGTHTAGVGKLALRPSRRASPKVCLTHAARAIVPKRDAKATRKFPQGICPAQETTLTWPRLQVRIPQVWGPSAPTKPEG